MSHSFHAIFQTTRNRGERPGQIDSSGTSAAEQTRLSWARLVRSAEELPEVYRPFMDALLTEGIFPYTVITPTFAGFMRRETEKLVCSVGDRLYVVEKVKGDLKTTCYAFGDIHFLETGAVLLNDWLQIRGRAIDGTPAVIRIKFNAVTERLFAPFIEKIRGVGQSAPGVDRETELKKFDQSDLLTFKFVNYARRSIVPGARITAVISQPEIRQTIMKVLGRSLQRTLALSHVLILTDRELIIVRDDPDSPRSADNAHYGGVWDYIPLNKIVGVDAIVQDNNLLALTVRLPDNDRVEALFSFDRREEVERFTHHLIEV